MYNAKYTQARRAGNQMPEKLAGKLDQFGLDWCWEKSDICVENFKRYIVPLINDTMPILCSDLKLVSYKEAYEWICSRCKPTGKVAIPKARPSTPPFYAQPQGADLLLEANEKAKTQSSYVLTKERWDAFLRFVEDHPDMPKRDLSRSESIREYGIPLHYWPVVIHISRARLNAREAPYKENSRIHD